MRWQLALGVFLAAATAAGFASRAVVESIGRSVGACLAACANGIGWSRKGPPEPGWTVLFQGTGPRAEPPRVDGGNAISSSPGRKRSSPGRRAEDGPRRVAPSGVSVRAATVLRVAESGARPSGVPVAASAACPAGIALVGVTELGVGLSDGDILVRAAGMPALDPAAVIGAVVASRGARIPAISGEICRDGVLFPLVVEQPYLTFPAGGAPQANGNYDERCLDPTLGECDAGSGSGTGG